MFSIFRFLFVESCLIVLCCDDFRLLWPSPDDALYDFALVALGFCMSSVLMFPLMLYSRS